MSYTSQSPAARLRQLLADKDKIIIEPGVYDGLSARIALHTGFDALYMTGAGASMSRTGMADLGLTTATEMVDNARTIANLDRRVPLIADADTGYGAPINVSRTVAQYINAGVAGFHLEDQVVTKKCGHLAGKECVSKEEYISRIKAAVLTRERIGSDIVIIARTDALQQLGLEEAINRLKAAVEAGADVAFLEAATQREESEKFCDAFAGSRVPLMYGMVQGSKAYRMTAKDARKMGYSIIVYAASCLAPTFLAVSEALGNLKKNADCDDLPAGTEIHKVFDVCGMTQLLEFDRKVSAQVKRQQYSFHIVQSTCSS